MRRIVSNYFRMLLNFVLGLLLIRLLIGIDEGVYVVVLVLGTSIGISGMMKEIVRAATVAEVGLALHQRSEEDFLRTYSTAFALSLVAAFASVAILVIFYLLLDRFNIPRELLDAAGYFLLWRMAHGFLVIAFAPTTNLLPVTGRMGEMNFWMTLERAVEVLAAWLIAHSALSASPELALRAFAVWSTLAMIAVLAMWCLSPMFRDRRFIPSLRYFDRSRLRAILSTVGWNGFVVAAMNLYGPFLTLVMNLVFGVAATVVFGIAIQLLNYIRIAVMGVAFGLDAVFTKKAGLPAEQHKPIVNVVTSMQGLIVFSLCTWIALHIETIVTVWLGDRLTYPAFQVPQIALFFNFLLVGIIARSVTEGWMKYLSGIGEVRAYGPLLLKGALFSPLLVFAAILFIPDPYRMYGPSLMFSSLLAVVHLLFLPRLVARFFSTSASAVLAPLLLPLLLVAASVALTVIIEQGFDLAGISALMASAAIFAALCGPLFVRRLRSPGI